MTYPSIWSLKNQAFNKNRYEINNQENVWVYRDYGHQNHIITAADNIGSGETTPEESDANNSFFEDDEEYGGY